MHELLFLLAGSFDFLFVFAIIRWCWSCDQTFLNPFKLKFQQQMDRFQCGCVRKAVFKAFSLFIPQKVDKDKYNERICKPCSA